MKKWIILGNKALTQENNTLAVKWLIILLPVFQRLQNEGNSSKNSLRGLVQTWIWNQGLSKQESVKQNDYPFICTCTWLEKMKGEKQECQRDWSDRRWTRVYVYSAQMHKRTELCEQDCAPLLLSVAKITNSSQCWINLIRIRSLLWQKERQTFSSLPLTQTANQNHYLWIPH